MTELIYKQIGLKVRSLRESLGISQQEIAKRCGLSRPTIVNFEAGRQRISLHELENIARAIGTTPKHIMKGIWL